MRLFLSLLGISIHALCFSQTGVNSTINFDHSRSISTGHNIEVINEALVKVNPSEEAWFYSEQLSIPDSDQNNSFIALSTALKYELLELNIQVSYRIKQGIKWSSWEHIEGDDHLNNEIGTFYTELVYLPLEAKKIQFKFDATDAGEFILNDFTYRLYFPNTKKIEDQEVNLESFQLKSVNCSCPLPTVLYRNDWCPSGNCPKDLTPSSTVVSHLVVHHSAGSNTSPDWAATVRSIWDYHVNTKGWDDIGYNFIIDPNGVIYEGRGNDVSGAHFSCMNPGTMGVCLLGNYSLAGPSSEMINSLTELMGWKACEIDEDPRDTSYFTTGAVDLINLCGHRDGNGIPASCTTTECPGDNVYAIMNNIRTTIYDYTQTCTLSPNYSNIVILEMGTSPNTVFDGDTFDLQVAFKNSGDAAINENLTIDFQIDNQSIGNTSFSSLAIDQSLVQGLEYSFNTPGTYNFCTYIDPASNEINTSNNSFCVNIEVLEKIDTSITSIINQVDVEVKVYPNPVSEILYVESDETIKELILHNTLGQIVIRGETDYLDLRELSSGLYTLSIWGENEVLYNNVKIIKQ